MIKRKQKWKRDFRNEKWPVNWNGREWFWADCHPIYQNFYTIPQSKGDDGRVYITEGMFMFPDGTTIQT